METFLITQIGTHTVNNQYVLRIVANELVVGLDFTFEFDGDQVNYNIDYSPISYDPALVSDIENNIAMTTNGALYDHTIAYQDYIDNTPVEERVPIFYTAVTPPSQTI